MKGIILAGGMGTRLHPVTKGVTKQLLPIYDKPMIYYSLSTLMLAGIRDVLIISKPEDLPIFERLFGSGENIGMNFEYKIQIEPKGIAEAFLIGEEFIADDNVCLILGDNIFYGHNLSARLKSAVKIVEEQGDAVIFGYHVNHPELYGIIEYDKKGKVISLEEKPVVPKTNCAAVGLYFYNNDVVDLAKNITASRRGELEITEVNNQYLRRNRLQMKALGRGYAWFDAGSHDSFIEASNFVQTVEKRQGLKIACIEEIAYRMGFISKKQLRENVFLLGKNDYSQYLFKLLGVENV